MNFAISAEHRVKLKESGKRDKYLDLARDLKKKLWNMKIMVMPIVISMLITVTEGDMSDESVHGSLISLWVLPNYLCHFLCLAYPR